MSTTYRHIPISGHGEPDPWSLESHNGPWRPLRAVLLEIQAAADAGESMVILTGHRPTAHPELPELAAACRSLGVKPSIQAVALDLRPDLEALGFEILWLPWHGSDHDELVGRPGAAAATRALLESASRSRLRLRVRVGVRGPRGLASTLADCRSAEAVIVDATVPGGPAPADRPALLRLAWETTRGAHVQLEHEGFDAPAPRATAEGPPLRADADLVRLLVDNAAMAGLGRGVIVGQVADEVADLLSGGGTAELGLQLRALGAVPMDLPPEQGGPTPPDGPDPRPPRRPPDGPTVIVVPFMGDALLARSTLPGLARRLAAAGTEVRLESVWHPIWNMHGPDPSQPEPLEQLDQERAARRRESASQFATAFLDNLDLGGAARVVVPGLDAAVAVLQHPSLPAEAQVEVHDLHMLDGHSVWRAAFSRDGAVQWPSDRVELVSCFPAYMAGYARLGFPARHIRWRPYPLELADLPSHPGGETILAAGNHRRDWATFVEAVREPTRHPMQVMTLASVPLPPHVELAGHGSVAQLALAVAASRFVVLPIGWSADHAAGISCAALALALGRPVVASRTGAMVDHLRDGWNALLVPPGDPAALAEAIHRLDTDDGLHADLSRGAAEAGRRLSTDTWAARLRGEPTSIWPLRSP